MVWVWEVALGVGWNIYRICSLLFDGPMLLCEVGISGIAHYGGLLRDAE